MTQPDPSPFSGPTTLTIENATLPLDGRRVRVVISNACAEDHSDPAPLEVGSCYPDCDTSTGRSTLDIFDFLCFQNRYAEGDPYACDCDASTGLGVCNAFDFVCFQNAFAAGCP